MIPAILLVAILSSCQNEDSVQEQKITIEQRQSAIESAMELINARRTIEALAITSTLVQKDPTSADVQETHALALLSEGGRLDTMQEFVQSREKYSEALHAYTLACEHSSDPGLLQLSTAQLAHMLKENDTAIKYYILAHENVPHDPRASFFLAQLLMLDSQWENAKLWITESLVRDSNEASALLSLALIEAELGNKLVAMQLAEKGCSIKPHDSKVRFIQARVLRLVGKPQQAMEILLGLPVHIQQGTLCQEELKKCLAVVNGDE